MQNCYRSYQSHSLLTRLTERLSPCPGLAERKRARLFCSLRCLFLHLAVTTCKCCVHSHSGFEMDVLHSPSKALAARHVCVCAVVELQHSVQINGGSRRADRQPFTSPARNCATWERKRGEKKLKRGRKEGERTCWDKSFRCCFSSSFLISFKGKFPVCVCDQLWPETPAFVSVFFFFFSSTSLKQPEHPEASQAIKPRSVTNEMHRRSTVRITSGSNYLFTRRVSRGSDVLKTNRRNGFLIDYCVAASFSSCLWTDDRSACLLIQITPAV